MSESPNFRVLCVGDGDLTLSLALARAYKATGSDLELVASTLLHSRQELVATYSNSEQVLKELEERNVSVLFGVDATNLQLLANQDESNWDAILFHHPHLGGSLEDEQEHAHRHYVLLAHYLNSAKRILKPNGVVHVCLCGQQPQTWRLLEAANKQELKLKANVSTTVPVQTWLPFLNEPSPVESHFPAPRRYRNGKLGSKHFLGKYGYRHRRTHGEHRQTSGCNTSLDVNVGGSLHYVFEMDENAKDGSVVRHLDSDSENECKVCGMTFGSEQELQKHYKAPALPDPVEVDANVAAGEMAVDRHGGSSEELATIALGHARDPSTEMPQADTNSNVTTVFSSIVKSEHDGKRLKWYLRRFYGKCAGISKQQTESMIKHGRIFLNGSTIVDSGRILRTGDSIRVMGAPESIVGGQDAPTTRVVEIPYQSDNIVVAFKPVGTRTIGSFSSQTLEMAVSSQLDDSFKALTKLDTGCAGLCVLQRSGSARTPNLQHVFTALVHGRVRDSWNGCLFPLDMESMRRWRKGGGDTKAINGAGAFDKGASVESVHSVTIQVLERTTTGPSIIPLLSTISITTSSTSSGLCNAICYLLRKRGHPIVNDRFCRNEYLALPRSIRNLVKNRLCIGCYQVELRRDEKNGGGDCVESICVAVPDRLCASHWQRHCEASNMTNERGSS